VNHHSVAASVFFSVLTLVVGWQEGHPADKNPYNPNFPTWTPVSSYFQTSSQNALLSVSLFHTLATRLSTHPDSF